MSAIIKKQKAQVMILDILILLLIVLLIINIQISNIYDYKLNIKNKENKLDIIEQSIVVNKIINDTNYLAVYNKHTNQKEIQEIEIKNIEKIKELNNSICSVNLENKNLLTEHKNPENIITRGVIYNNKFKILEVGFCE